MITWKKDLYLGKGAEPDKWKIIRGIRRRKLQFGVYVIVLAVNGRDIFDVIPAFMLSENSYKGRDIRVLGIAVGKSEAIELAGQMILDALNSGTKDIRGYFS